MNDMEEKRYPGVGLLLVLVSGAAFWGTVGVLVRALVSG